ncbi:MAG: squalene/phytoene synthase family protein [Alphaproteobacteria bacterium]|nr:squalene/phytoene synthase family protein [Alphaproteobacteria bacterium]
MTPAQVHCAAEAHAHDFDRWLAALFAPESRRGHVHALIAFNLELARIADQVSQPLLGQMRLQWWREALEGIGEGRPRKHPVVLALAEAAASCELPAASLLDMIDARELDVAGGPPETLADLIVYGERTAGSLNELTARVLGVSERSGLARARRLGGVVALLGLLRSHHHHAARGRVFLPRELIEAQGLSADRLRQEDHASALARMARLVATEAGARLQDRERADPRLLPVLLQGRLARLYLRRLAAADYDLANRRLVPSGPRRQLALLAGWLTRWY